MVATVISRTRGGGRLKAFLQTAKSAQAGPRIRKVEVGFFSDAKYPDGTPVTNVAAWNEFGTRAGGWGGPTPERPFFRNALPEIRAATLDALQKQIDPRTMVVTPRLGGIVGNVAVGAVQRSITTLRQPANAEATVRIKGSSNPLIRDGFMRASVTYRAS